VGSAQTPWGVHKKGMRGKKEGKRWPQAWTPKNYDRSPPLALTASTDAHDQR